MEGLWNAAVNFTAEYSVKARWLHGHPRHTDWGLNGLFSQVPAFNTNCEVASLAMLRSVNVQKLHRFLDQKGGYFLQSVAMSLRAPIADHRWRWAGSTAPACLVWSTSLTLLPLSPAALPVRLLLQPLGRRPRSLFGRVHERRREEDGSAARYSVCAQLVQIDGAPSGPGGSAEAGAAASHSRTVLSAPFFIVSSSCIIALHMCQFHFHFRIKAC